MEKQQIIDYIMSTPTNTNWSVLSSMLGDGDWTRLKAYVETTPHNMNRMILEALLGEEGEDTPVVKKAYYIVDQGTHYVLDESRSDFDSQQEVYNYCAQNYVVNSENPTIGVVNNFEFYYGNIPVHNYTDVTYNMYSEGLYGYEWYDNGAFSEEEPQVYIIAENGVYQYSE